MTLVFLFLTAAIVVAITLAALNSFWRLLKYRHQMNQIPGPKASPIWGNLDNVSPLGESSIRFFEDTVLPCFPKVCRIWLGPFLGIVMLNEPEGVKKVFKASTEKADEFYKFFRQWIGDGLLLSRGPKWFRNRRLLTPGFHFDILKSYMVIYNEASGVLLSKWKRCAENGEKIKVFDTSSYLTLDIILRCACSYKSNCQIQRETPYIQSIIEMNRILAVRALSPLYNYDWIFQLSPLGWKARRAAKVVHRHSETIIENRKNQLKDQNAEFRRHLDFLDILLLAKDEDGVGLTDQDIRDEVDTFVFEGHDTTASGLAFALLNLAKFPYHQQKCYEEIKSALSGPTVSSDDLGKLTYLSMFIKESLRLYPPVPLVYRTLEEPVNVDGCLLPAKCFVGLAIFLVHRNPLVWSRPKEFNPLRFSSDAADSRDPYAFIPFSAGSRNCIGQNFVFQELKVTLARILARFTLLPDESYEIKRQISAILKTENGGTIFVKERDEIAKPVL